MIPSSLRHPGHGREPGSTMPVSELYRLRGTIDSTGSSPVQALLQGNRKDDRLRHCPTLTKNGAGL